MSDLLINLDADLRDAARHDLRLMSPEWMALTLAQKLARLAPYARVQAVRDERRKEAA